MDNEEYVGKPWFHLSQEDRQVASISQSSSLPIIQTNKEKNSSSMIKKRKLIYGNNNAGNSPTKVTDQQADQVVYKGITSPLPISIISPRLKGEIERSSLLPNVFNSKTDNTSTVNNTSIRLRHIETTVDDMEEKFWINRPSSQRERNSNVLVVGDGVLHQQLTSPLPKKNSSNIKLSNIATNLDDNELEEPIVPPWSTKYLTSAQIQENNRQFSSNNTNQNSSSSKVKVFSPKVVEEIVDHIENVFQEVPKSPIVNLKSAFTEQIKDTLQVKDPVSEMFEKGFKFGLIKKLPPPSEDEVAIIDPPPSAIVPEISETKNIYDEHIIPHTTQIPKLQEAMVMIEKILIDKVIIIWNDLKRHFLFDTETWRGKRKFNENEKGQEGIFDGYDDKKRRIKDIIGKINSKTPVNWQKEGKVDVKEKLRSKQIIDNAVLMSIVQERNIMRNNLSNNNNINEINEIRDGVKEKEDFTHLLMHKIVNDIQGDMECGKGSMRTQNLKSLLLSDLNPKKIYPSEAKRAIEKILTKRREINNDNYNMIIQQDDEIIYWGDVRRTFAIETKEGEYKEYEEQCEEELTVSVILARIEAKEINRLGYSQIYKSTLALCCNERRWMVVGEIVDKLISFAVLQCQKIVRGFLGREKAWRKRQFSIAVNHFRKSEKITLFVCVEEWSKYFKAQKKLFKIWRHLKAWQFHSKSEKKRWNHFTVSFWPFHTWTKYMRTKKIAKMKAALLKNIFYTYLQIRFIRAWNNLMKERKYYKSVVAKVKEKRERQTKTIICNEWKKEWYHNKMVKHNIETKGKQIKKRVEKDYYLPYFRIWRYLTTGKKIALRISEKSFRNIELCPAIPIISDMPFACDWKGRLLDSVTEGIRDELEDLKQFYLHIANNSYRKWGGLVLREWRHQARLQVKERFADTFYIKKLAMKTIIVLNNMVFENQAAVEKCLNLENEKQNNTGLALKMENEKLATENSMKEKKEKDAIKFESFLNVKIAECKLNNLNAEINSAQSELALMEINSAAIIDIINNQIDNGNSNEVNNDIADNYGIEIDRLKRKLIVLNHLLEKCKESLAFTLANQKRSVEICDLLIYRSFTHSSLIFFELFNHDKSMDNDIQESWNNFENSLSDLANFITTHNNNLSNSTDHRKESVSAIEDAYLLNSNNAAHSLNVTEMRRVCEDFFNVYENKKQEGVMVKYPNGEVNADNAKVPPLHLERSECIYQLPNLQAQRVVLNFLNNKLNELLNLLFDAQDDLQIVEEELKESPENYRIAENCEKAKEKVKQREADVNECKKAIEVERDVYESKLEEAGRNVSVSSYIYGKGKLSVGMSIRMINDEIQKELESEKANEEMKALQARRERLNLRRNAQKNSMEDEEKIKISESESRRIGSERMKRNLHKIKGRYELFDIRESKEKMIIEKEKAVKKEYLADIENTFVSQTAVTRMAAKRLEDFVTKLKDSRGDILVTILSRILDECRQVKAASRILEVFKKIKIPLIVKKSKRMLAKQQLRNWLRLCNRFLYLDRGMPIFYKLKLKLRVFKKWIFFMAERYKHESNLLKQAVHRKRSLGMAYSQLLRSQSGSDLYNEVEDENDRFRLIAYTAKGVFLQWVELTQVNLCKRKMINLFSKKQKILLLQKVFLALSNYREIRNGVGKKVLAPYLAVQALCDMQRWKYKLYVIFSKTALSLKLRKRNAFISDRLIYHTRRMVRLKNLQSFQIFDVDRRLKLEQRLLFDSFYLRGNFQFVDKYSDILYGGSEGDRFKDNVLRNGKRMCLQKLEVWTGDIIDGLCLHVRGLDPEVHGVQIGNKSEFDFQENEALAAIEGFHLDIGITRMRLLTTKGRVSKWYGNKEAGEYFKLGDETAKPNRVSDNIVTVIGFTGRKTFQGVKALGVIKRFATDVEVFANCWLNCDNSCTDDGEIKLAEKEFATILRLRATDVKSTLNRCQLLAQRIHKNTNDSLVPTIIPPQLKTTKIAFRISNWLFSSLAHGLVDYTSPEGELDARKLINNGRMMMTKNTQVIDDIDNQLANIKGWRPNGKYVIDEATLGYSVYNATIKNIKRLEGLRVKAVSSLEEGEAMVKSAKQNIPSLANKPRLRNYYEGLYKLSVVSTTLGVGR